MISSNCKAIQNRLKFIIPHINIDDKPILPRNATNHRKSADRSLNYVYSKVFCANLMISYLPHLCNNKLYKNSTEHPTITSFDIVSTDDV